MIVQCEICQAKYNIDDSKITPQGVRVRCAKCQHIFSVKPAPSPPPPPPPPPPPTPEPGGDDFLQDFESFEKFHKDLLDTPGLEAEPPQDQGSPLERGEFDQIFREQAPSPEASTAEGFPTEEWPGPFPEEERQGGFVEGEMETPTFDMSRLEEGLKEKESPERPLRGRAQRKTSWSFVAIGILIILAMVGYYLWTERGMRFNIPWDIPSLFSAVPEKVQSVLDSVRGIERGSLNFSDLEGYKDTIGKVPVFVITGKIQNDTNKTKKHVRIKAVLLNDKNRVLDEKETLCGSSFSKEELKKLPSRLMRGDFRVRPRPDQMAVAPRTTVPFIVIFPNMPSDANEFQVEIVEAPNA